MEVDKGERSPFPYKRGPLPLDLAEEKKGNHGLSSPKKSGRPSWPLIKYFFGE